MVIDEFGWPEGSEATGQPPSYPLYLSTGGQLNIYGYGYELNNAISYLDQQGVGWAAFAWDGGANPQGPWQTVSSYSTYTPNVDGNPVYDSLQGQSLNCENPPPGYV